MKTNRAQAVPQAPPPREINAKFRDRLPVIMSEICQQLVVIDPAVNRLNVQLNEFLDYLDFEIKKVDLDIKRMQWEAKSDPAALNEAESWLQKLQQLKADFNIDVMISPPQTIRNMVDRVEQMFGV